MFGVIKEYSGSNISGTVDVLRYSEGANTGGAHGERPILSSLLASPTAQAGIGPKDRMKDQKAERELKRLRLRLLGQDFQNHPELVDVWFRWHRWFGSPVQPAGSKRPGRKPSTPVQGERLKAYRGRLYMTQSEFASRCGVDVATIQRGENGNGWDAKTYAAVADGLSLMFREAGFSETVTPEDLQTFPS